MFEDGGGAEDVLDASGQFCNTEKDSGGVTGEGQEGSSGVSTSEEARRTAMPATMKVRRTAVYSTRARICVWREKGGLGKEGGGGSALRMLRGRCNIPDRC